MKIKALVLAAATGFLIASMATAPTVALAQDKPAATKPRTAKSLECSTEADKRGLKGKERKKFRNACKHGKAPPA